MALQFEDANLIFDRERRDGKVKIVVRQVLDHRGFEYIDIRRFERAGRRWAPTQRGITLQANEFLDVMRGALNVIRKVREKHQ